jgi:hypothetical protein
MSYISVLRLLTEDIRAFFLCDVVFHLTICERYIYARPKVAVPDAEFIAAALRCIYFLLCTITAYQHRIVVVAHN